MKLLTTTMILASILATQPAMARGTADTAGGSGTNNVNTNSSLDNRWEDQNKYWRNKYPSSSYYNSSRDYTTYEPAYRYGVDLYNRNPNMSYDQLDQAQLSGGWDKARGSSSLDWSDAQMATRDAYNRMYDNRNSNSSMH